MSDDLRRESEEFIRYYTEIGHRIGRSGLSDLSHLLTLYDQLKAALAAISTRELVWADQQAQRLVEKLQAIDANFQAVRRLKVSSERDGREEAAPEPPLTESTSAGNS